MLTQVNYEVKGQLAKLLATEDLIIENRKVSTASFDVARRVLTLPMWEKASGTVYDLLVGHEVGHALYTPADDWTEDYPNVPPSFINVLEDVRIEKLMKVKYAGLSKTFYNGYSQLAEQDFFELESHDLEDMSLADRINIHYKIGNFTKVSFNSEEQWFVDQAFKTNTFKDVLELAQKLYEHIKEEQEQLTKFDDLEFSFGEEGSSGQGMPFQPSDSDDGIEMEGDSDSEDGDGGEGQSDSQRPSMEDLNDDLQSASDISGGVHGGVEGAVTDKALQSNLENLNKESTNTYYEPEYVELPQLNLDTVIASNKSVHEYLTEYWIRSQKHFDAESESKMDIFESVDNNYRLFRRSAQKEVNYLVKEFECRKSADAYARATVAKTGILDCTKLHSYKYNEDLFKKITVLPDGKNHGLMFVLDWSGSMSTVLMDTVKQLFNLIWFCKKVQIPFQVFAFTNEWNHYDHKYDEYGYRIKSTLPQHHEEKDCRIKVGSEFSMVEFFTSDCKKSDLEKQMLSIWRLATSLSNYYRWDSKVYYQAPRRLNLSGTPLNEALVCLNQIIPQFKKSTGVQKVQCVTLTDGEAHPLSYNKFMRSHTNDPLMDYMGTRSTMNGSVFIRDKKNGKTYSCNSHQHELTSALLNQLRGRFTDVNFIGIRVMDGRDANSFIRRYMNWDFDKVQHVQAAWKKDKSIKLTDVGYHAYFGMSSTALGNDTEFTVKEEATKAQIKSAFKKSLNNKKMNKKVLSQFMEFIA
tara:strand:+ start:349 stop:2592 length:2244 start_codon:yes stop_codon:yes gene_type:complete